jgi:hypothetical protein
MKNRILISSLVLLTVVAFLFSCRKDKNDNQAEGNIRFSFILSENIQKSLMKSAKSGNDSVTSFVISINRKEDNKNIYEKKKIELYNFNGDYISSPVSLSVGDYYLTEFEVTDDSNNVLYYTPQKGDSNAYLVKFPLPLEFTVRKDSANKLLLEVVSCGRTSTSDTNCDCNFDTTINMSGNVLSDSQQINYFNIWKAILLKKNSMTEDYYKNHISKQVITSSEWSGGISFRVDYIMHIDWIDIKCSDAFFVKMNSSYTPYGYLNIPRDVFFDQGQIESNITNGANSEISVYNLAGKIKYKDCCELINAMKKNSGYEQAEIDYASYYVPGNVPRENGDPYVMIKGTVNKTENLCLNGHMNLITGECKVWLNACVFY